MSQWAADDARLRRLDRIRLWSLLALVSLGIVALVLVVFGGDSALPPKPRLELQHHD